MHGFEDHMHRRDVIIRSLSNKASKRYRQLYHMSTVFYNCRWFSLSRWRRSVLVCQGRPNDSASCYWTCHLLILLARAVSHSYQRQGRQITPSIGREDTYTTLLQCVAVWKRHLTNFTYCKTDVASGNILIQKKQILNKFIHINTVHIRMEMHRKQHKTVVEVTAVNDSVIYAELMKCSFITFNCVNTL